MIAREIAAKVQGASAYTLAGGYAVWQVEGRRELFPPGRQLSEKRNDKGRVTHAVYEYADGSKLTFRWSPQRCTLTPS